MNYISKDDLIKRGYQFLSDGRWSYPKQHELARELNVTLESIRNFRINNRDEWAYFLSPTPVKGYVQQAMLVK